MLGQLFSQLLRPSRGWWRLSARALAGGMISWVERTLYSAKELDSGPRFCVVLGRTLLFSEHLFPHPLRGEFGLCNGSFLSISNVHDSEDSIWSKAHTTPLNKVRVMIKFLSKLVKENKDRYFVWSCGNGVGTAFGVIPALRVHWALAGPAKSRAPRLPFHLQ